ncbi:MAG: class I SAM-dependent methyltransferase, partial [Paracoccus sp. (in: a-proteobacteria)]|nr:class I SAM-dependent methyltransferase [Paracoccus sp. (in: a-proteobacteria)]
MGFSPEWLSLREPVDRQARDADLLARAVRAAGSDPVIMDLGCGTGSTLRAFAAHLPDHATWHLIDNDPALLQIARTQTSGNCQTHVLDLGNLDALPLDGVTLVTASALLDLMPANWVGDLATRLAARGIGFYGALSYDGVMQWEPALPRDPQITDAFNHHQRSDKGLGQALGPDAATFALESFAKAGFDVSHASTPWRIDADHAAMHRELVQGIAEAAAQAGASMTEEWARARIGMAADSL